jgi:hypothetical protein
MSSRWQLVLVVLAPIVAVAVAMPAVLNRDDKPAPSPAEPRPTSVHVLPSPAPSEPADDVTWDDALGVRLAVSHIHGPQRIGGDRAAGFARTEAGAGFAAAHLVARTSPSVGPAVFSATLAEQVRGPNRLAMEQLVTEEYEQQRQRAGVQQGQRIPGADAEVVGYRVESYENDAVHATVLLVLTSPGLRASGRFLSVVVTLQWADDDWQLIAPPQGDWVTVSRVVATPPTGLVGFGEAG